ncbi:hypothetical protein NEOC84_000326|uniref:hypothetical protein n=1 Tax=Neochlamydia sp. AcF84 TaxID=2315858 RepID=UPI00140E20BC|nr:hypothetical protein [Neochlamydia sp. AcF84]NGY94452.1 hypothetical protein [Neochlamydia sp. AcF84]
MLTCKLLIKDKHRLEKGQISQSTWQQYGYLNWRYIQEELQGLGAGVAPRNCGSFAKSF